ncbi:MAG: hypothetical protein ACOYNY_29845 [Caldilineaceae bacterium]|jgi:hypothetical protein
MQKYYLRQCSLTQLDNDFGLRQVFANAILDQWLTAEITLSAYEKDVLQHLRHLLLINTPGWNEQELALHFIGPLLSIVQFTEPYRFNLFAERRISAIISGLESEIELSGEPDGMIATGYREPKVPLFAFTEYKRQIDPEGDPAGQTLAAMLVGQALNGDHAPLYGAYVVGSDWRFMVLENKHYTISRDYSALSDEIFDILRMLKALKAIILDLTA